MRQELNRANHQPGWAVLHCLLELAKWQLHWFRLSRARNFHHSLAWFDNKASMPKLWQSLRSCWAIAVKALTTMTVDPIVKKTFSMMFCVFVQTRRHEEASHQHGKGLPIARWQSSHHRWRIWWCLPVKFYQNQLLNLLNTHKKVNLEITKLLGETRVVFSQHCVGYLDSISLLLHPSYPTR